MFKKLVGKRSAREKWDAGLIWFRLRYLTSEAPTQCINLLSRPQACGRVALYWRPGSTISQLYLGVSETHVRLLQRMAADFGFSLKPRSPEIKIPVAQRMMNRADVPWARPFVAHITNEMAFVSLVDGENNSGSYLPLLPSTGIVPRPTAWCLPGNPPPGLSLHPSWNGQQPPAHLMVTELDSRQWLLGRSPTGIPLHVSGQINIYGRQEAVAEWLVQMVTHMITLDHANLVVIDGAGDLVSKLKRKAAVTRLLGEQLAYVDIDGPSLTKGFNPLAAAPDEAERITVLRWQRWFRGMNVHPQGIQLLVQAQQDGVVDIPSLRKWLKQAERAGQHPAVSSLAMAVYRLTANRSLREWLEWPTNRFNGLPAGALFFACKGITWERQQLLRAALLVGLMMPGTRLVVHGLSGERWDRNYLGPDQQIVVSNGPLLPGSTIILAESHPENVAALTERFLFDDPQLGENLALLGRGESMVKGGGEVTYTNWNRRV